MNTYTTHEENLNSHILVVFLLSCVFARFIIPFIVLVSDVECYIGQVGTSQGNFR